MTVDTATNAMWEQLAPHTAPSTYPWDNGALIVGGLTDNPEWWKVAGNRHDICSRYSWTITAPATVDFVTHHSRGAILDPMAGSGWWAHLLTAAGVNVAAYDAHPPGSPDNHWHKQAHTWHPITVMDGAEAAARHSADRTLLLSWPPYDEPAGADILRATTADRVIYIGEGPGGCCGDDDMFDLLSSGWADVGCHRPVQWYGIHDFITVYQRRH